MKIQLKPFVVALLCAGCFTHSAVYAQTDNTTTREKSALELQVEQLKKEMRSLKHQIAMNGRSHAYTTVRAPQKRVRGETVYPLPAATTPNGSASAQVEADTTTKANVTEREVRPAIERGLTGAQIVRLLQESKTYLPFDLDVPGQSFVSTGPYVGVPIQFSGSNLLINSPSVNTDWQLLQIRQIIHKQLMSMGGLLYGEPYHSHLLMSGLVEAQANYTNYGGAPSTSGFDVSNMSLDFFFIGPSDWLLGFVELSYNNGSPRNDVWSSTDSYTVANSRVYVNKAFITIGNLDCSRFYTTFGQFYVPFGTYSTVMVSDTLPKLIARTKARALLIGFAPKEANTFFAGAYIFRGDSHAASVSKINNGGINLGYIFDYGKVGGRVGAGVIANIADSGGMQEGTGFANNEQLTHRVPAYNLRAVVDIGPHIDIIGEYVGASTRFNPNDMSYNGHGAKPSAIDIEATYSFTILGDRPTSIGLGYAKSNQALALGIPLTRTSAVLNTSLWRNTLQSIEFRYDRHYAASDTANGPQTGVTPPGTCTSASCSDNGKADKAITAQFDYYF